MLNCKFYWPKFYIHVLSFLGKKPLGTKLVGLDSIVKTFQPVISFQFFGCTSTYRPLSYPLRTMKIGQKDF